MCSLNALRYRAPMLTIVITHSITRILCSFTYIFRVNVKDKSIQKATTARYINSVDVFKGFYAVHGMDSKLNLDCTDTNVCLLSLLSKHLCFTYKQPFVYSTYILK